MPSEPVKQFALPLFATIADILPFETAFLVRVTGAATTLLVVNTADATLSLLTIKETPKSPSHAPEAITPSTAHTPPSIIFMEIAPFFIYFFVSYFNISRLLFIIILT